MTSFSETRLCVQCAHCETFSYRESTIVHHECNALVMPEPVMGIPIGTQSCAMARADGQKCGPQGALWQAKPPGLWVRLGRKAAALRARVVR